MATQLEFEKRKELASHSDVKTNASQVLLPPTPAEKQVEDVVDDQVFCVFCECYHKPDAKLRCAFNRAIKKIEEKLSTTD